MVPLCYVIDQNFRILDEMGDTDSLMIEEGLDEQKLIRIGWIEVDIDHATRNYPTCTRKCYYQ